MSAKSNIETPEKNGSSCLNKVCGTELICFSSCTDSGRAADSIELVYTWHTTFLNREYFPAWTKRLLATATDKTSASLPCCQNRHQQLSIRRVTSLIMQYFFIQFKDCVKIAVRASLTVAINAKLDDEAIQVVQLFIEMTTSAMS